MRLHQRLDKEAPLLSHAGVFHRGLTVWQGAVLIISATIGAGILGLPFAIAKIGIGLGVVYIIALGALIAGLNLLLGEIAVRAKEKLQLVGLARKYLGPWGGGLMTAIMYFMLWGVLAVYLIGEGQVLAALFGGRPFFWSTIFFVLVSLLVYSGLRTIKTVELFLSLGVLAVLLLIAGVSAPQVALVNFRYFDLAQLLFPYGVILFAYHGTTAVPEAHSLLIHKNRAFKQAIILAAIINTLVYLIFTVTVVGVTGFATTEIATIGLGERLGPTVFLFGNLFAVLAMGTSCLMAGVAFRDSLGWDYKLSRGWATLLAMGLPYVIFSIGLRGFITAIDLVGGVFISLEMLMILLIYWRAKQAGDLSGGRYKLHHVTWLVVLLLLALLVGSVYSVGKHLYE